MSKKIHKSSAVKAAKAKSSKKSVKKTAKVVRSNNNRVKLVKVKPVLTVESMINSIVEAIQYKFADDKTAPGLTISKLKNEDFYVSVVRFGSYFGKEKMVEYKARGNSLMNVLMQVADQIIQDQEETNPIVQLSKYLFTTEQNVSEITIYDME